MASSIIERKTSPSWSELLLDITIVVAQRLSYRDFIRFGAVCKPWREAFLVLGRPTNSNYNMPWVVTYGCSTHGNFTLDLCDPVSRETYAVTKIIGERDTELFEGATICASKYGWLLLSKKLQKMRKEIFFFYNPFRNKIVRVFSPLLLDIDNVNYVATFTAPPADHGDCVIYVLENTKDDYCIVSTFNIHDHTTLAWTTLTESYGLGRLVDEITYKDGRLFCKSPETISVLGTHLMFVFDMGRKLWVGKPLKYLSTIDGTIKYSQLVEDESDGSIYWLVCKELPNWEVFKYDGSRRDWFKIENMKEVFGNKMWFLRCGPTSTVVELPPVPVLRAAVPSDVWELQKVDGQSDLRERCQEFDFIGEAMYNSIEENADDYGVMRTTTLIQPPQLCYGD